MPHTSTHNAGAPHLRFVFGRRVVSCEIRVGATLEDVASTFARLGSRRYGKPVAINLTLPTA